MRRRRHREHRYVSVDYRPKSKKVRDFLASYDIAVDVVKAIPSSERPRYLIDRLLTRQDMEKSVARCGDNYSTPGDVGLIMVKPELQAHISKVESFLGKVGIESKRLPIAHITKEEWLSMYGYKIRDAPDIINLYVTQRALGMTPIIFRHLAQEDYLAYATQFGVDISQVASSGDPMEVFDRVFCGSSYYESKGTLRWDVARLSLEGSGFHCFTDQAEAFDLYNFYREGHQDQVYRVFNGIHLPSNEGELQRNLGICLQ